MKKFHIYFVGYDEDMIGTRRITEALHRAKSVQSVHNCITITLFKALNKEHDFESRLIKVTGLAAIRSPAVYITS